MRTAGRETDTRQREVKTGLMQKLNRAYAANDLLTLLELQLQIEQIDAGHIAHADLMMSSDCQPKWQDTVPNSP